MEKEELLEKIKEIGTCEDEVTRRSLLVELEENISSIYDSNSALTEQNTNLTNEIEKVKADNMKLFLRVGETKSTKEVKKDSTGIDEDNKPEELKFEDLIDEKGGLK